MSALMAANAGKQLPVAGQLTPAANLAPHPALAAVQADFSMANYLSRMGRSFRHLFATNQPTPAPMIGDFSAMESVCHLHSLTLMVVDGDTREIITTIRHGGEGTEPHFILYTPGFGVRVGHYEPLRRFHNPSFQPLSDMPQMNPVVGTEVHFHWIPNNGRLFCDLPAVTLFDSPWVSNPLLPIPREYRASFSSSSPNWVQADKMHGDMLSTTLIRRCLQIFYFRIERQRGNINPQPPRTLVWDHLLAERMFRLQRNASRLGPCCAAGTYSFHHAWRFLTNSTKSYPVVRTSSITAAELLDGYDNILLPYLENMHFVLIHIRVQQRRVRVLDSAKANNYVDRNAVAQHLCTFMCDLQREAQRSVDSWTVDEQPPSLPQQSDIVSCGLFDIGYAAQIFAGHDDCDQLKTEHIHNMRVNLLHMLATVPPSPPHHK